MSGDDQTATQDGGRSTPGDDGRPPPWSDDGRPAPSVDVDFPVRLSSRIFLGHGIDLSNLRATIHINKRVDGWACNDGRT